jgi:hypothetical protein
MTQELVDYIRRNYSNLINDEERRVLNKLHDYGNWLSLVKVHGIDVGKDKTGLFDLTMDEIDSLASIDPEELENAIAARIWNIHKDELFINRCPTCGGIARTKEARRCRKGHRW